MAVQFDKKTDKGFMFFSNYYNLGKEMSEHNQMKLYYSILCYLYDGITPTFSRKENEVRLTFNALLFSLNAQLSGKKRANPAGGSTPGSTPDPASQEKEIEREKEKDKEEEKKMLSCESIKENPHIAENSSSSLSRYPETVEEVLEIAERPDVAAMMTRAQAEAYFINRQATNWIDGLGRKIAADRLGYDIKRWCSRDEERKNAGASGRGYDRRLDMAANQISKEEADEIRRTIGF